jgi:molybdopterin-guanine dinucleotide biosynthesis protein A
MPISHKNPQKRQSQPSATVLGVILVGGQSKRMGFAKERASIYGQCTMLEHIVKVLSEVCGNILIVGKTEERLGINLSQHNNVLFSPDNEPGHGPLSGITTALEFAQKTYTGCLVIACDQPLVKAETLRVLIQNSPDQVGVFFKSYDSSFLQPLPGYFPTACRFGLLECLNSRRLSLRKAIDYVERTGTSILRLSINKDKRTQLISANDQEALKEVRIHFSNS